MQFLVDQRQKPSILYALFISAVSLISLITLMNFSWMVTLVASCSIGLLAFAGLEIFFYLKPIVDDIKITVGEFRKTAENITKSTKAIEKEKTIENVNKVLLELSNTAKTLDDNLKFDVEKGEKPISKELTGTLTELQVALQNLGKNLEVNPEKGQQPLAQELTETVQSINNGLNVARTLFTPFRLVADGSKKLGRTIGLVAPENKIGQKGMLP